MKTRLSLILILSFLVMGCKTSDIILPSQSSLRLVQLKSKMDIQAHRGGMGLMPENSIEAMINAVDLGVRTLELDLFISQDEQVVVYHYPYMHPDFVLDPKGNEIVPEKKWGYCLYTMTYDSIYKYDIGSKFYDKYPLQKKKTIRIPLLCDLLDEVERYTMIHGLPFMKYNIEIKSREDYDGKLTPEYKKFAKLAMDIISSKGLGDRITIQSFDARTLNYIHDEYPDAITSYLVSKMPDGLTKALDPLNHIPDIISPSYDLVNQQIVNEAHNMDMKIIPWTIDTKEDIRRFMHLEVDGIISNYPDRAIEVLNEI